MNGQPRTPVSQLNLFEEGHFNVQAFSHLCWQLEERSLHTAFVDFTQLVVSAAISLGDPCQQRKALDCLEASCGQRKGMRAP